jgi:phage terminase large subunit-like protein
MAKRKVDKRWREYAEKVVSGKIIAGKYIRLACERYLYFLKRKDIFFDEERMDKIERFINHMKHFQGKFNNKPFILLPWQRWILASIFGFYYKKNPTKRVCEYVVLFVGRKNAKTALSAALLLAEMCVNKEHGSEQYLAANTRD